jgi:hypothetical protein
MTATAAGRVKTAWIERHVRSDTNVAKHFAQVGERSPLTRAVNEPQFGRLMFDLDLTPEQFLRLAKKPDAFRDKMNAWVTTMRGRKVLDTYIQRIWSTGKAYLKFRGVATMWVPNLKTHGHPSLDEEMVPSPDEMGRIINSLPLRGKVVALFMCQSGLRPGVLSNQLATDGLRFKDLVDFDLERVEFRPNASNLPEAMFRIRRELSKNGNQYVGFMGDELRAALCAYVAERKQGGEKLDADSPVIGVAEKGEDNYLRVGRVGARHKAEHKFVTRDALMLQLKAAIQKQVGKDRKFRPYLLRSYFSSRAFQAELAGATSTVVRKYFTQHTDGADAKYNTDKALTSDFIEDLRNAYHRIYPYVSTTSYVVAEVKRTVLETLGKTPEEIPAFMDQPDLIRKEFERRTAPPVKTIQATVTSAEFKALVQSGVRIVGERTDFGDGTFFVEYIPRAAA